MALAISRSCVNFCFYFSSLKFCSRETTNSAVLYLIAFSRSLCLLLICDWPFFILAIIASCYFYFWAAFSFRFLIFSLSSFKAATSLFVWSNFALRSVSISPYFVFRLNFAYNYFACFVVCAFSLSFSAISFLISYVILRSRSLYYLVFSLSLEVRSAHLLASFFVWSCSSLMIDLNVVDYS
jgi:hypothetical protein